MRMRRISFYILSLCCLGVLSWCGGGSSSESREVMIEKYTFALPVSYIEVSSALVENKQLVNKVVWSWKIPAELKGNFEPNIIMTRSDLPPELNFEQFRTLNAQKMSAWLAWYQPWTKEVVSFMCDEDVVQGLLVYFRLQDPRYTKSPEVWFAQYQFVHEQKWYIISAAYQTEKEQTSFLNIVESLTCQSKTTW